MKKRIIGGGDRKTGPAPRAKRVRRPAKDPFAALKAHIARRGEVKWKETIGYVTYKRTYARRKVEGDTGSDTEEFPDTLLRVIRACNEQLNMNLTPREQCRMYDIFANFKAIPAGRFLWQLGTDTVRKYGLLSLQNCAFTVVDSPVDPFCWTFDCLMLGSGVGYNIQSQYIDKLPPPRKVKVSREDGGGADFIVPDTREGWVNLLRHVLSAHFVPDDRMAAGFTYSCSMLRSKGAPIKGFGGTASGPENLCMGMEDISAVINRRVGAHMRPIDCLDIMNIIARTVVSGNVRRCLPRGTLVHTTEGLVRIDSITIDHVVITHEGESKVVAVMKQGKQKLLCIDTTVGRLRCTPDHRMAVWATPPGKAEFPTYTWKAAKDITTRDKMVWVLSALTGRQTAIDDIGAAPAISVKSAYCLGFFHANAYGIRISNGTVGIPYGSDYIAALERGEFKFSMDMTDDEITINSPSFAAHMTKARNGGIPAYILCALAPIRRAYLEGFGAAGGRGHIRSNITMRHMGAVYASLGVMTRPDMYTRILSICTPATGWFAAVGQLPEPLGVAEVFGMRECRVPEMTYDIEVEEPQHAFVIDSGLLSHNSAQIAIGDCDDIEFLRAKRWDLGSIPNWRCFSNNSVVCADTRDLPEEFWEGYKGNGECYGLINLELSRRMGRIGETQYPDPAVTGYNPCGEQSLADRETCCLSEIFLPNIDSPAELIECAKIVYRVSKHSLALKCHHKSTEAVVNANMRMGIGVTGVLQSPEKMTWLSAAYEELRAYDKIYSAAHGFPRSIKLTTVKPSGCVAPETRIVTDEGIMTMAEIFKLAAGAPLGRVDLMAPPGIWYSLARPLSVAGVDGKFRSVTRLYDNGAADVCEIAVAGQKIICTPEHKFAVRGGGGHAPERGPRGAVRWRRANRLRRGDEIISYPIAPAAALAAPAAAAL